MDVLVLTVVHTPLDARIHHRQIRALLDAGHRVRYAAPFTGYGIATADADKRLTPVDVPRARGRRRLRAWFAVRRLVATASEDVVIVHDPELLAPLAVTRTPPVIWDVHEDLVASLSDKPWLPRPLRPVVAALVAGMERRVERRHALILAESGYQARFRRPHPVFANRPWLPPSPVVLGRDRVVYLGRVSVLRGGRDLLEVARRLANHDVQVHVIGPIDPELVDDYRAAERAGILRADGFVPNDEALARLDGALAGLSLLHDHPNYRHSLPTKILEYQASGLPVVTTPLPEAVSIVRDAGSGVIVPFGDPAAVAAAVLRLRDDPEEAARFGASGRWAAETGGTWDAIAGDFVAFVTDVAAAGAGQS